MDVHARLAALRALMRRRRVDAYLVPSSDPHQSEYVPTCWERRQWVSGFTGSAGDVLVTAAGGGLWTDGRYFLQAERELAGSGLALFRSGEPGVPTLAEYLARDLAPGAVLGVDPRVVSMDRARSLESALAPRGGRLRAIDTNLVDEIWDDRPPVASRPITIQSRRFAGETTAAKLERVRAALRKRDVEAHVLTALDNIAWLYNVRGTDVDYNPVAIAYALVTRRHAYLFVDPAKVPDRVRRRLAPEVTVRPYPALADTLAGLDRRRARVWLDPARTSRWIADRLSRAVAIHAPSPVPAMQACKNPTELAGMRRAHARDGVAMARFLHWLEGAVPAGGVTEMSAASRLAGLRAEGERFKDLSFPTISGYAEHGAVIHYGVTEATDVPLRPRGIYLVDSGGQYLDGTTDITRTVLLGGRATREQRDRFTRVLKGHIALAEVRFPEGTHGPRLDTLARQFLWRAGLDYAHGTGHGVGAYLNVHEGPQSISPGRATTHPLEVGNVLSNEPGYYEAGAYGIRIENLMEVVADPEISRHGRRFQRFEILTLCPIDRRLVLPGLLVDAERAWLDRYHRRVRKTLSPLVDRDVRDWLRRACAPLE